MPEDETDNKKQRAADATRKRRRDQFLTDLAEAQRLRERVAPRRARMARLRQQQLMRTFFH
jgi:hypothetical protein